MADHTGIEWTDATWNPIVGCSIVSKGCTNCYAMRTAGARTKHTAKYEGLTQPSKAGPVWTGDVRFWEKALTDPLRWREPRRVFVNSMGDLFAQGVPDEWIDRAFAVMALAPQHTFQVLTKRPARMRNYLCDGSWYARAAYQIGKITGCLSNIGLGGIRQATSRRNNIDRGAAAAMQLTRVKETGEPLPNVWLGVSTEDQATADERIPHLLETPAAVRFISAEPLLAPLDLRRWLDIRWQCSSCREFFSGRYFATCPSCGSEGGWSGSHSFNGRHRVVNRVVPDQSGSGLDWVIVGGESGHGARPMHPDWARSLRDQCQAAGVPFFFKQWGEFLPVGQSLPGYGKIRGATAVEPGRMKLHYTDAPKQEPKHAFAERGVAFASMIDGRLFFRVGKKAAGRLLDARAWDEFPEARP